MSDDNLITRCEARIGEQQVGEWTTVSQENINSFADATGDHQWIHVDPERAAKESPFGGPVAHGYLTLSMIPVLMGALDPDAQLYPPVRLAVNYGLNKVRFPSAVAAGAKLRARHELLQVEEIKGGVQLTTAVAVEIEGADKPACVAETVTRLYA